MTILLFCTDVVGSSMAGPAMRYWEFAKELSKRHSVILSVPNIPDIPTEGFVIHSRQTQGVIPDLSEVKVIITQIVPRKLAAKAKWYGVKIILDAYDPVPLEILELFKHAPSALRDFRSRQSINELLFAFQMADAIICANLQQRDLWMGLLMGLGRLTPKVYDEDVSLKQMIDIVPFGLSSTAPQPSNHSIRERFHLKSTDKLLLWGGGIWNWFDPLTLIRAVHQLSRQNYPVRLVFMGIKHPNPKIPEMQMASNAIALAKELQILDSHVFFNYGWTPLQERQQFLLESDIGVSTHSEHLETRYAFRTRMLDYIWAGLPIIATEGDSFADLIRSKRLGFVVPYQDPQAIVHAVKQMIDLPDLIREFKTNLEAIRSQFYWENVIQPIEKRISLFSNLPRTSMKLFDIKNILYSFYQTRGPAAIWRKVRSCA